MDGNLGAEEMCCPTLYWFNTLAARRVITNYARDWCIWELILVSSHSTSHLLDSHIDISEQSYIHHGS